MFTYNRSTTIHWQAMSPYSWLLISSAYLFLWVISPQKNASIWGWCKQAFWAAKLQCNIPSLLTFQSLGEMQRDFLTQEPELPRDQWCQLVVSHDTASVGHILASEVDVWSQRLYLSSGPRQCSRWWHHYAERHLTLKGLLYIWHHIHAV